MMRVENYFESPVFHIDPEDEDQSIVDESYIWALSFEKQSKTVINSNRGGFQSAARGTFDLLPARCFNLFERKLSFLPEFYYLNWWLNINRRGDFNSKHTHPDSDVSVIFYLTENHGSLAFEHPCIHSRWVFLQATDMKSTINVNAKAGTMLIFPSDLAHSVEPHLFDAPRISIAFNLRFLSSHVIFN